MLTPNFKQTRKLALAAALVSTLLPSVLSAQPVCHEPAGTEFRVVSILAPGVGNLYGGTETGTTGPVAIAVAPDKRVFIAKMLTGEIRMVDAAGTVPATSTTLVGTIPTYFNTEDGLLGITLDPNFATTNWLYALYSDPCGQNCANRACELARFTVTNNQLTNKKVIMRFDRAKDDTHHAAGGMSFDKSGVLVIGTGDNTDPHDGTNNGYGPINFARVPADAQRTAANTNDLRGKVLRIKPIAFADGSTPAAGVGTTYDIPSGNLWEKINNTTYNPGWDATDSISKVRKEIYAMGDRNPYHPRVDSRSGWIFWGEVGPDAGTDNTARGPSGHDEWNLATGAGFFGHPYCNGYNVPYNMNTTSSTTFGGKYNCAAIVNNSVNNTGVHHLPPAISALAAYTSGNSTDDDVRFSSGTNVTTISHGSETAVGGPMYRYDSALASTVKFPPFYEGKIFFFDWARRNMRVITMNPDGTIPAGAAGVKVFAPTGLATASYIDMQFGPDGAMYLLKFSGNGYGDYTPALYRIEYTGVSDSACYKPFIATVGPGPVTSIDTRKASLGKTISPLMANGFLSLPSGYKTIELYDLSGRKVWSFSRQNALGDHNVKLPATMAKGIWRTKLLP